MLNEILKCVVICCNCHRKHHAGKLEIDYTAKCDKKTIKRIKRQVGPQRPSKDDLEKLLNLLPMRRVAKQLNVTMRMIGKWRSEHGIKPKHPPKRRN